VDDTEVVVSMRCLPPQEDGAGDVKSRALLIAADDELEGMKDSGWSLSLLILMVYHLQQNYRPVICHRFNSKCCLNVYVVIELYGYYIFYLRSIDVVNI
jgi:hypothetical protein